jgi:ADP-ribose pyrophosphatase YjhB (NUDIX family)
MTEIDKPLASARGTGEELATLALWSDRLQAIARTGLFYAENNYDRERYEQILAIAAEMASPRTGLTPGELVDQWARDIGYVTPKVGVAAVVFDADEALLLLQRPDIGLWCPPLGWADIGETAAAAVVREVKEETGLVVEPLRMLGIYDGHRHRSGLPYHFYNIVFECRWVGGTLTRTAEALDLGYFRPEALPPLMPHLQQAVADAFASREEGWVGPVFDA